MRDIKKAKEEALLAFWSSVAESFSPDNKTGYFPPGYDADFNILAEEMIFEWLRCNERKDPYAFHDLDNPEDYTTTGYQPDLCRIPEEHDPSCRRKLSSLACACKGKR